MFVMKLCCQKIADPKYYFEEFIPKLIICTIQEVLNYNY